VKVGDSLPKLDMRMTFHEDFAHDGAICFREENTCCIFFFKVPVVNLIV